MEFDRCTADIWACFFSLFMWRVLLTGFFLSGYPEESFKCVTCISSNTFSLQNLHHHKFAFRRGWISLFIPGKCKTLPVTNPPGSFVIDIWTQQVTWPSRNGKVIGSSTCSSRGRDKMSWSKTMSVCVCVSMRQIGAVKVERPIVPSLTEWNRNNKVYQHKKHQWLEKNYQYQPLKPAGPRHADFPRRKHEAQSVIPKIDLEEK